MTFDDLPNLLDGAQAVEWILSSDADSTRKAALGDDEGWAGGWWECARSRHGMGAGRRGAVNDALLRLFDALRAGDVRGRAGGRDIEPIEWATLGIVDAAPNLLLVKCRPGAASDIDGQPLAIYRDDLRRLRAPESAEALSVPEQPTGTRPAPKLSKVQRRYLEWLDRTGRRGCSKTQNELAEEFRAAEGAKRAITARTIQRAHEIERSLKGDKTRQ